MRSNQRFFAVALLLAVVALFFFPLSFGGFQSTHGPTSALDSGSVSHDVMPAVFLLLLPVIILLPLRSVTVEPPLQLGTVSISRNALLCTFRC